MKILISSSTVFHIFFFSQDCKSYKSSRGGLEVEQWSDNMKLVYIDNHVNV